MALTEKQRSDRRKKVLGRAMTAMMVFALAVLLYGVFGVLGNSEVDKPSNEFRPEKGRRIDVGDWREGQYQYVDADRKLSGVAASPSAIEYRWLLMKQKNGSKPFSALWLPTRQGKFLLPRATTANEIQPFSGDCLDFRPPIETDAAVGDYVVRCYDVGLRDGLNEGWQWSANGSNVTGHYLPLKAAPLSVDGQYVWLSKP